MIGPLLRRVRDRAAQRRIAPLRKSAESIRDEASRLASLDDGALRQHTAQFRQRIAAGDSLDDLTIPAFATVCEAARRALGEQPFPSQIVAGLVLARGAIAEMKTGEGKTLAATMPCYLHALTGQGVHVVTTNDYLAARDAAWMGPLFGLLGLSVGVIRQHDDDDARRTAYACDITYGTSSEFGFDYLRDNMRFGADEIVRRAPAFTLVDEADAILIDEARIPLVLHGPLADLSDIYRAVDHVVRALEPKDYDADAARKSVSLTDRGIDHAEAVLCATGLLKKGALHDAENVSLLHRVTQALRAHAVLARDRDYLVSEGEVVLIDALTGRAMPGRRFDDSLHQALEAKEGCEIKGESHALASITFQNFFRLHGKLAGMSGTALADQNEYEEVYGLHVVAIPAQRPTIRTGQTMVVQDLNEKHKTLLALVDDANTRGQPVLIGAPSLAASDELAGILASHGYTPIDFTAPGGLDDLYETDGSVRGKRFAVLNARHHASEAAIIAMAGVPGAVTIATAMAGRGTDIRLGGRTDDPRYEARHARAVAAGGLLVIGSAHHDLARLDDQLRGRAGRQGDPGRAVFLLARDDDIVAEPLARLGERAGSVTGRWLEALKDRQQALIAARQREERRALLRFDEVIHAQRERIYRQRMEIMTGVDPLAFFDTLRTQTIDDLLDAYAPEATSLENWQLAELDMAVRAILTMLVDTARLPPGNDGRRALRERIVRECDRWMDTKRQTLGQHLPDVARRIMLALIDQLWAEHSERLDHLKWMVNDRRLPPDKALVEYRLEAFELFDAMVRDWRHEVCAHVMRVGISN